MLYLWFCVVTILILVITISKGNVDEICSIGDNFNKNSSSIDVVALILARGGSKGIPRKNLVKINNVSLLGRTLKILQATKEFSQIFVSTEDDEIALEAEKYGAIIHKRPEYLAQDHTSSIEAVQDFISMYKGFNKIALFQCTSIFLKQSYILKALELFQQRECVFSVTRSFKFRWTTDSEGFAIPLNFDPKSRVRRQDWSGELVETGMFYFTDKKLLEQNLFQNNRCGLVEIAERDSLELDTIEDLKLAEFLFKIRRNESQFVENF